MVVLYMASVGKSKTEAQYTSLHSVPGRFCESGASGSASASQAEGCGFESRLSLNTNY